MIYFVWVRLGTLRELTAPAVPQVEFLYIHALSVVEHVIKLCVYKDVDKYV